MCLWMPQQKPQQRISLGSIFWHPKLEVIGMCMYFFWVFHKILQNTGRGHKPNSTGSCPIKGGVMVIPSITLVFQNPFLSHEKKTAFLSISLDG